MTGRELLERLADMTDAELSHPIAWIQHDDISDSYHEVTSLERGEQGETFYYGGEFLELKAE